MNVAGEGWQICFKGWLVGEREAGFGEIVLVDFEVPLGGGGAAGSIVIAADQKDMNIGMVGSPAGDGVDEGGMALGAGVEEISQDNEAGGGGLADEEGNTVEISLGGSCGNGNAEGAKGGAFAEVDIGEEKGMFFGPPDCALGQEVDGVAAEFDG
jgi:hypothetical protein